MTDEENNSWKDFKNKKILYEAHLENFFFEKVKEVGAMAIKFSPVGNAGLPDAMVFHHGLVWLVELKMPGGSLQPHQKLMIEKFARHGHKVQVLKGKEQVLEFIEELKLI